MKNIFKLSALVLVLGCFNAQAETVTEKIATSKSWSSYILTDHSAWGSEACIASTSTADSILEVYSEKTSSVFTEPTVQILFANIPVEVYSADVSTGALTRWFFTKASSPNDPSLQAVIARLGDRQAILAALKKGNTVTVKLKDVRNKLVKTMQFSLSGSSKGIDSQFAKCGLKFEELI